MHGKTMNNNNEEKFYQLDSDIPETPRVEIDLGPDAGNATRTRVILTAESGNWEFDSFTDGFMVECFGNWERRGLADALERVIEVLRGKEGN
jgi:hypothetical protein